MSAALTVEALSVASFGAALDALPHETRATVTATENGQPWAVVEVSPLTDTARSIFPCYLGGQRGDTERRAGHRGAIFRADDVHPLRVVIERSRRMLVARAAQGGTK